MEIVRITKTGISVEMSWWERRMFVYLLNLFIHRNLVWSSTGDAFLDELIYSVAMSLTEKDWKLSGNGRVRMRWNRAQGLVAMWLMAMCDDIGMQRVKCALYEKLIVAKN